MIRSQFIATFCAIASFVPLYSECNFCADLSDIEGDVRECCNDIRKELTEILQDLENQFPCDALFAIDHVPFPITVSGKYCVTTDLVYSDSGAAITVIADDVTINFHNHSLQLNDPDATGILVQNVDEFVLKNDAIIGTSFSSGTGAAVQLVNVNKALLDNIYTSNINAGVVVEGSTAIFLKNSFMQFHATGMQIDTSQGVTVDRCTFQGSDFGNGFFVDGGSENVSLTASSFTSWSNSIFLNEVTGILIEDCLATASGVSAQSIVQVGGTHAANDVTIRNSTLLQPVALSGFSGMNFVNGAGALLENLIVDAASTNGACLHIKGYSDMFASACMVLGKNSPNSLHIEAPSSNITFASSTFSAHSDNIVIDGGTSCTIIDSISSNSAIGDGILISSGQDNAIINCIVDHNMSVGIKILPFVTNSHISGNRVFANQSYGLLDEGTSSEFYFNTSCNNEPLNDCGFLNIEQLPSDPAVVGSNVCCSNNP